MLKIINHIAKSLFILVLSTMAVNASAESSKEFGNYVIHYNSFRSDTLSPEVAKSYDLMRRNNRIIVNISVLKKVMGTTGVPVAAVIEGNASNLTGQLKALEFREIREGNAIYYLAESKVSDGELLKFDLKITPDDLKTATRVQFEKRFFTH